MIPVITVGNSRTVIAQNGSFSIVTVPAVSIAAKSFVHAVRNEQRVSDGRVATVVSTLPDDSIVVKKPIPVVIEYHLCDDAEDDEYVVVFPPAGIAMSGDSVRDALLGFKEEIVDSYHLYKNEPALGPEPTRRLKVLEQYVGEKGGK